MVWVWWTLLIVLALYLLGALFFKGAEAESIDPASTDPVFVGGMIAYGCCLVMGVFFYPKYSLVMGGAMSVLAAVIVYAIGWFLGKRFPSWYGNPMGE